MSSPSAKEIANRISSEYEKEVGKIFDKYVALYEDRFAKCAQEVWDFLGIELYHGFKSEFPLGYDNSWNNQLEPYVTKDGRFSEDANIAKLRRDTSDHDRLRFIAESEKTKKEDNKNVAHINIGSVTQNPYPIWKTDATDNIDDWIVEGKIRPLPPRGMWWEKSYWESIHYPAIPLYDDIEQSSKFQQLKKEFYADIDYECKKAYKKIYQKIMEPYLKSKVKQAYKKTKR
jgi:hypothetical protein